MNPSRGLDAFAFPIYGPIFLINPYGQPLWQALFGSSEKYLPGVMKTEEPENQVTLVAQTICLAKKCLDLIVDAFHAAVVDPVLPPCKNAALMAEESSGHLPH